MDQPRELLDLKPALARLLKRLRGSERQYAIAKRCGINAKLWSRYERAKVMPQEETLSKIAAGVGMTLKDFTRRLLNEHMSDLDHLAEANEIRDRPESPTYWDGDAPDVASFVDRMFAKPDDRHPQGRAYQLALDGLTQLTLAFQLKK